jgi:hypothetical protein
LSHNHCAAGSDRAWLRDRRQAPRRASTRRLGEDAKPTSSSSSVAPITRAPSSAPESANNNSLKRRGDGAAGDLTIVRPAARLVGAVATARPTGSIDQRWQFLEH